ncbi:MAG TPA: HNH endonuclease [Hyphomonadaceae bacterium]|jgi:Restriction endonuclease|nr:HNH endonuclease [Hyphomonadaceae bacterium]
MKVISSPLAGWPALVLNADFRPLSYYPLSTWPWQEAIKAVFLGRVDVIACYEHEVRSPSFAMRVPSVICLRDFVPQERPPAFTRFNVFLRDGFACQYCGAREELTFDHLIPRSKGGRTTWENIVTACGPCNLRKGGRMPREADMQPRLKPHRPSTHHLQDIGRRFPPHYLHETWTDFLYWETALDP